MDRNQSRSEEALEAAVFRRLLAHMDERADVQNIDLMNLAGFCRNCLSKWYVAAAEERGIAVDYESAREIVYGMSYADWKEKHQTDIDPQQMARFEEENRQSS
ncbi:MAG: DUF1244 domain-containing protein [Pseudomonadales bacterium]